MPNIVVAVDGPSASGKSTVAKSIAAKMGFYFVESGALYRAMTWEALQRGIQGNADACAHMVEGVHVEPCIEAGAIRFTVDGKKLIGELRSDAVNENVSVISTIPAVRRKVVSWLRATVERGSLVIEGRDIGTAVFPDAQYKFYLDASASERARRRHAQEGAGPGRTVDIAAVRDSLTRRDVIDSSRKMDPLRPADDAVIIDTTNLNLDEVVSRMVKHIESLAKIRSPVSP